LDGSCIVRVKRERRIEEKKGGLLVDGSDVLDRVEERERAVEDVVEASTSLPPLAQVLLGHGDLWQGNGLLHLRELMMNDELELPDKPVDDDERGFVQSQAGSFRCPRPPWSQSRRGR
jgi:hypothetical protein